MGGGSWTAMSFNNYSRSVGRDVDVSTGVLKGNYNEQDIFKQNFLADELNPYNVMRECCDSEEHPNTIPVIIGLDVTGSMGKVGVEVAKKINVIITELYKRYKDIEIMIMGIGDLAYDDAPVQISQFESDIRIAEQLDKVYMEHGGGGNGYESYSVAWYFGLNHCNLDCWKRGKKGIIITTGDEPLNPYLPKHRLNDLSGDFNEANIETDELYKIAKEKYDIYHIAITDSGTSYYWYKEGIKDSFGNLLKNNLKKSGLDELASKIIECIDDSLNGENIVLNNSSKNNGISW